jgi:hypothetical protein
MKPTAILGLLGEYSHLHNHRIRRLFENQAFVQLRPTLQKGLLVIYILPQRTSCSSQPETRVPTQRIHSST